MILPSDPGVAGTLDRSRPLGYLYDRAIRDDLRAAAAATGYARTYWWHRALTLAHLHEMDERYDATDGAFAEARRRALASLAGYGDPVALDDIASDIEAAAGGRPRFRLEPLLVAANERLLGRLADLTGRSKRALRRMRASGLTTWEADALAVACGLVPWEVWPEWFVVVGSTDLVDLGRRQLLANARLQGIEVERGEPTDSIVAKLVAVGA